MIYRNFLLLLLVALFCANGFKSKASGYSPADANIVSYEKSSLTAELTIEVWYHFLGSA